jgi:hypothetical protein
MRQASVVFALLAGIAGLLVQDALAQGKPPMPFRVQIVYSPLYAIDLGGLEKLHPFDIRKYEKIYKQLQADIVFIVGGCDTLSGGYSQDAWRTQYQSISHLIETYGVAR